MMAPIVGGKCQKGISEGYSRLRCTVTELTLWKRNDCQQGPPRPIKSMQTWITLRHCCQSTADEGQRIKGFWLTFLGAWWALLGFHWLANERLVQRHWMDKNKVTCLASDEDFFFLSLLSCPMRHKWSWIFSSKTLNLTIEHCWCSSHSGLQCTHSLCHIQYIKQTSTHAYTYTHTHTPSDSNICYVLRCKISRIVSPKQDKTPSIGW